MATTLATASRELLLTREFGAPRELVWLAWTDPSHLARGWGPRGFSAEVQLDLRVGAVEGWESSFGKLDELLASA